MHSLPRRSLCDRLAVMSWRWIDIIVLFVTGDDGGFFGGDDVIESLFRCEIGVLLDDEKNGAACELFVWCN